MTLRLIVARKLILDLSPGQVSGRLKLRFSSDDGHLPWWSYASIRFVRRRP